MTLRAKGHPVCQESSIPKLLRQLGYCRQVNRKTLEGSRNPDRDAQFEHINAAKSLPHRRPVSAGDLDRHQEKRVGRSLTRTPEATIDPRAVPTRSRCMTSPTMSLVMAG